MSEIVNTKLNKRATNQILPPGWRLVQLREVIDISHGFPFSSEYFATDGHFKLLTPGNFYEEGGFRSAGEKQKFYTGTIPDGYLLPPKTLIVAMTEQADGLLGSSALVPQNDQHLHNQRIGRVSVKTDRTLPEYLFYLFNGKHFRSKVRETAAGTKVKHTSPEKLTSIEVVLPSCEEQAAISSALSDTNSLISSLDQLIAKKSDIQQAAMQQLLTGQRRLPGFSGEWEVKRLGEHLSFLRNGTNSRAELSSYGNIRYLHYGDIHGSQHLLLNPTKIPMPYLSHAKAKRLDRLEDGDLIFADASEDLDGVGKSVEVQGLEDMELVAGLHTIALRFDKKVMADGYKAYLQFIPTFRAHLRQLAAGTKVYATNRTHIASAEIRLPGADEQTAIATILADMDTELAALEARRDKARQLKQGMMQELLTGRIRLV